MKKSIIVGMVVAASLFSLSLAYAQLFDPEKAIAAGDHKALADYYRSQVNDLKKLSEQHEKMRDLYQKNHNHYRDFAQTMAHHCENLRLQLLQSSYIYEALAKEEEKLEKKGREPSLKW